MGHCNEPWPRDWSFKLVFMAGSVRAKLVLCAKPFTGDVCCQHLSARRHTTSLEALVMHRRRMEPHKRRDPWISVEKSGHRVEIPHVRNISCRLPLSDVLPLGSAVCIRAQGLLEIWQAE